MQERFDLKKVTWVRPGYRAGIWTQGLLMPEGSIVTLWGPPAVSKAVIYGRDTKLLLCSFLYCTGLVLHCPKAEMRWFQNIIQMVNK